MLKRIKSSGCFKSYTHSELLNLYVLIFSHREETFQMEIVQKHVDRDPSYGSVHGFFEYVYICERVHHNGNDLRGQSEQNHDHFNALFESCECKCSKSRQNDFTAIDTKKCRGNCVS